MFIFYGSKEHIVHADRPCFLTDDVATIDHLFFTHHHNNNLSDTLYYHEKNLHASFALSGRSYIPSDMGGIEILSSSSLPCPLFYSACAHSEPPENMHGKTVYTFPDEKQDFQRFENIRLQLIELERD